MLNMSVEELKNKIPEYKKWLENYEYNSRLTLDKYSKDVLTFCNVLELDCLQKMQDLTTERATEFINYGLSQEWSKANINNKMIVVKIFFKWLHKKGYLKTNEIDDIKALRNSQQVKFTMPIESKDMLLSAIEKHSKNKRMLLMVKLCLATGLRKSELVNLKVTDLKEKSIIILGKGEKIVEQSIPRELSQEIYEYVETEREENMQKYIAMGGQDLDYLFVSGIGDIEKYSKKAKNLSNGNQVCANSFAESLKHFAKIAGIAEWQKVTPHGLRRLFGTCVYNQTKDPLLTQRAMRHSSFETTQKSYIADNRQDLERIANECTPLSITSFKAEELSKDEQIKILEKQLKELKGELL